MKYPDDVNKDNVISFVWLTEPTVVVSKIIL